MTHTLINGDVLEVLPTLGHFACCFLDPPDALGLKLNGYREVPKKGYINWLAQVMEKAVATLWHNLAELQQPMGPGRQALGTRVR